MLIIFASRTNNISNFVKKIFNKCKIHEFHPIEDYFCKVVNKPFILITYTDYFGDIPKIVEDFLEINHLFLKGIAGSGNRNFGSNFARAVDEIAIKYKIKLIHKFELSGSEKDCDFFLNEVEKIKKELKVKNFNEFN